MSASAAYPVRVEARLEPELSRWLWLVKWFLVIPHYIVLAFLWIAFIVTSAIAFFSILFTRRYPRAIFEFNVGVLRWSWRVAYYAYGALATDRYPPFTLEEVPDYPARLTIEYPGELSRGLVLVKWWLLAIPHYIIVGVLLGGGWAADRWEGFDGRWLGGGGLIGILVLVAGVILAFSGRYPQQLFDFILGLNRWALRVAAYAGLMTDEYPPFRFDGGGSEGTVTMPGREATPGSPPAPPVPAAPPPVPSSAPPSAPSGRPPSSGWTGGRIVSLVIGVLLVLAALGPLAGSGAAFWFDRTQRDDAGFVTLGPERLLTSTHALTSEDASFVIDTPAVRVTRAILGTVRIRVTPADPARSIFIGLASRDDFARYLGSVDRDAPYNFEGTTRYRRYPGGAPSTPPAAQDIWVASSAGPGTRTITWDVEGGSWVFVTMDATGARGVDVRADFGARVPALGWVALGLLVGGVLMIVFGTILIVVPIRRSSTSRAPRG